MKVKIASFTAAIMLVVLCVFDVFIYFSLEAHLKNVQLSSLTNSVESMSQFALNKLNDGPGDHSGNDFEWLSKYAREHQSAYVFDSNQHTLGKVGDLNLDIHSLPKPSPVKTVVHQITIRGKSLIVASAPIINEDSHQFLGYAEIISDTADQSDYMQVLLTVLLTGSAGAVLLMGVGAYFISSTAVGPLSRIIKTVSHIEANRLSERVPVPTRKDEVSQLAKAFNRMLGRIERSWDQQSRFVADASHEIRTPLTVIQGYANLLARWGKKDPKVLEQAIGVIQKESTRLHNLAEDLLTLALIEVSANDECSTVNVASVLNEVIETLRPLYTNRELISHFSENVVASMAPAHFKRVCMNLLDNALKYTSTGGTVRVTTIAHSDIVNISFQDTGPGIPSADLPYVFERFYRVDKSRDRRQGGTGLGLAIVKELVELYGGQVFIQSEVGHGTTVDVHLPTK